MSGYASDRQTDIEREIFAAPTLCPLKWTSYLEKYWQRGFYWLAEDVFQPLDFHGILRKKVLLNENEYVIFFLDYSIAVNVPGFFKKYIPRAEEYVQYQYMENGVFSTSAKLVFLGIDPQSFMLIDEPLSSYLKISKFADSDGYITQED